MFGRNEWKYKTKNQIIMTEIDGITYTLIDGTYKVTAADCPNISSVTIQKYIYTLHINKTHTQNYHTQYNQPPPPHYHTFTYEYCAFFSFLN